MEENNETNKPKQWFQDNLRIIISILIVVLIAGGIYSYSKRNSVPAVTDESQTGEVATQDQSGSTDKTAGGETQKSPEVQKVNDTAPASQETNNSFIETAGKGDGSTKLARRALANYLEKNPDSALTAEHKIFIEDYLRKKVGNKGGVKIGTTAEFSKDLIQEAVNKSKNLNERQLKNLHKYAVRVPSLS